MKETIIILFLFVHFICLCQDTIKVRQGSTIEGKVIEINPQEIKYKRADNPDGPTYIISKSQVEYLQLKNGEAEYFEETSNKEVNVNPVKPLEKIEIRDEKLYHEGEPLWESDLIRLVRNHPDPQTRSRLEKEVLLLKKSRQVQQNIALIGLVGFISLPLIALTLDTNSHDEGYVTESLIGSLVIVVATAIAVGNKIDLRKQKMREIAKIYNSAL